MAWKKSAASLLRPPNRRASIGAFPEMSGENWGGNLLLRGLSGRAICSSLRLRRDLWLALRQRCGRGYAVASGFRSQALLGIGVDQLRRASLPENIDVLGCCRRRRPSFKHLQA